MSRDYAIDGYTLGCTPGQPNKEPQLFDYKKHHVLCYDIETEWPGPGHCMAGSPILCVSLVCTCGWELVVSRAKLRDSNINHVVLHTNKDISLFTIDSILRHCPSFTVGHNIYAFDNIVLALSLPSTHPYTRFFRPVTKSATMTSPSMGLIMCAPGINNFDTYMFIRASMFGRFKQFSLDALCKQLNLSVQKLTRQTIVFDLDWFTDCAANALNMVRYNLVDCMATLGLCTHLDLMNQVVALCYCSHAWVEDVMLYNTGAMATSCLCHSAANMGYVYNWTRCDWKPSQFYGGEILFRQPLLSRNVMVVDFVSMYPSIISSMGVSPESIDPGYSMYGTHCRFVLLTINICRHTMSSGVCTGVCVVGTDKGAQDLRDPPIECIVCESSDTIGAHIKDNMITSMAIHRHGQKKSSV